MGHGKRGKLERIDERRQSGWTLHAQVDTVAVKFCQVIEEGSVLLSIYTFWVMFFRNNSSPELFFMILYFLKYFVYSLVAFYRQLSMILYSYPEQTKV